ncbi:MAG: type II toxin-antitoxin system RelE/ParE family toxin [Lacipirellulaceae bacterium]
MTYRVVVTEEARIVAETDAAWWAQHRSPEQAARWLDGLHAAVAGLAESPLAHGLARESKELGHELREMLYGLGGSRTHRVLYEVRGDEVLVVTVRHTARDDYRPG